MENSSIKGFIKSVKNGEEVNPLIMGILNLTPDSFYDGGKYQTEAAYLERVEGMIHEGADVIDLGAVSTRPGAPEVSEEEEWKRIEAPLKQIRKAYPSCYVSVDTWRAEIAKRSIENGANIINDISGGTMDEAMFNIISNSNAAYILMHIHGTPQTMQQNIKYNDVTRKVADFFEERTEMLESNGFDNIILDPGFGFGKEVTHNYKMLHDLKALKVKNYPILVGISRKSMINKVLNTKPEDALHGTITLNTIALLNGANILRVHDVMEAKEALTVVKTYEHAGTQQI